MREDRTVTVATLDHGPVTLPEPSWCRGHDGEPVGFRDHVVHHGPALALTVPSRCGPVEWLYARVDEAPFRDPGAGRGVHAAVEMGGSSERYGPEELRRLADALAAQLERVRRFADDLEALRAAG
ncbi:DUF6907 domain-containing protein [Streptomyces sp. NPDC047928]|uniref:DUF6907 domain-containing protein n=1 Tax=unclassified Streptomyces TaxID=2593676 RepID=UPI0037144ECF